MRWPAGSYCAGRVSGCPGPVRYPAARKVNRWPRAHQRRRGARTRRGYVVQCATVVVRTPAAPVADASEELVELLDREFKATSSLNRRSHAQRSEHRLAIAWQRPRTGRVALNRAGTTADADIVVVGGGTSGAALAGILARDTPASVLLLKAAGLWRAVRWPLAVRAAGRAASTGVAWVGLQRPGPCDTGRANSL